MRKIAVPISYQLGVSLSYFLLIGLCVGCVGKPPLRTYTIARTAIESAKRVEGAKVAPEEMHLAEDSYRKGEFYFKMKDYSAAGEAFEDAIEYAEKVENQARTNRSRED